MGILLVGRYRSVYVRNVSNESLPPIIAPGVLKGSDTWIRGIMSKFEVAG